MLQPIIHGILLSLGLILPLGAQNVFVFNQGANHKSLIKAAPVIITASLSDTLLISLAVLGVSVVLVSFPILQLIVYIVGLIFLLYMAWSLLHEVPANLEHFDPLSSKKQIGFALSVSLLNPHAIMDTIGVIGTNAALYSHGDKVLFSLATIAVSWLWFIFLAVAGKMLGSIDKTGKYIIIVNKLSSCIIIIIAILILKNIIKIIVH
ncbi:LysE/ArgO family amino acid transporter [Staphylococcus durrellii]|uniref:LysE/ArgO family amino acid transporter n=1 Tax=Staphylococcus durrellii TaxID=2781773 RepID=UPI00189EE66D|nr:LysE family transporter [Staphylococcus durrellii]MBF7016069.1 LysE family transporter [Staphylococcus durrellii]